LGSAGHERFGECFESLDCAWGKDRGCGGGRRIAKGMEDVFDTGCNHVVGRGDGHGDLLRKPSESVGDAFLASGPDPGAVAAIGLESRADVPAIDTMWGPGAALRRLLVDEDSSARRSNGSTVEIEGAMDLGPCGELGIDSRAAKKIQREHGLGEKFVPELEWKIGVGAAEAGDEMVLESANGALGGVAAMDAWGHELESNGLVAHVLLEEDGGFVVEAIELGAKTSSDEDGD
jgi:hypothetical protein